MSMPDGPGGSPGNPNYGAPAAPTTGTAPGTATNTPSGTLGAFYMQDPQQAVYDYLAGMGINPNIHSLMGDFISGLMNSIAPALFQNNYGSNGQLAVDQLAHPGNLLGSIFNGNGLGANLQAFANQAWSNVQHNPNMLNLAPAQMQRMLTDLNALSTFGQNPYQAAANQQALAQQIAAYKHQQTQAMAGNNPNSAFAQSLGSYIAGMGGITPSMPTTP